MKIRSVKASCENLELTRPYSIAYKTVEHVENAVVKIELENGITGIGTANPGKMVVGTDVDDTMAALSEEALSVITGRDIREFYSLLKGVHTLFGHETGARAALDIALHDTFTQWLGVPLSVFLGKEHNSLPTSITIGIKDVAETLEEAEEYRDMGFSILKVKLGQSVEEDIERLVKLREKFGQSIMIRIDANQAYSLDSLKKFHAATHSLQIELVEQPLPVESAMDMKLLPSEIRDTIAADESLLNAMDAFDLAIPPAACGIFNIKLMKCGGIRPALSIAEVSEAAGIDLMWGCNDESIVSITAALHTALSCRKTRYLDLDGSFDLAKDIVDGGFMLKNGWLSVNGRAGLGVHLL